MSGASEALGERFRAAREARGLSLSDVAEQIRIRSLYLAAIEDENWSTIGAPVYVRGFLRTYARFLGLDPGGGRRRLQSHAAAAPARPLPRAGGRRAQRRRRRGASALLWGAATVAVLLIAFVVFTELTMPAGPAADQRGRATASAGDPPARRGDPGAAAGSARRACRRRRVARARPLRPLLAARHR